MTVNTSADDAPIVAPNSVRVVIAGLIRSAIAPGRGWTYDSLEAATGLRARRLKSYVHEDKEPSLSAALSIALVLGKPSVNALLALIGYTGQPHDEADETPPMAIAATAMLHLSTIATAAADGRIDHIERPGCREAADAIIATVLPLSSAGSAV